MKNNITIMLVEDHPEYRKAVTLSLENEEDMELIGQFGVAERALRSLQNNPSETPDVVLLDLHLPEMSGLEAIPWIKTYAPTTKIIVLTQSDKEADVVTAISAGASGYLLKSTTRSRLADSIRTVVEGGVILDAGIARYLLRTLEKTSPPTLGEHPLTDRELEILKLIGDGLSKKNVAKSLGISPNTVAVHAAHIYEKLNVPNAPAAVNRAHHLGLFRPED
jgi:DNA-binding NarL/FixJ family response regulator